MSNYLINTKKALATSATEYTIPYRNNHLYNLAVSGGDVAIQRMGNNDVKVDLNNSPVLAGEEVNIKTQSKDNLLYFTPTVNGTYIEFIED
jgi:hypothetical protein